MQRISDVDTKRLCSGQVITCLADAVKELLDNSLDSGANNIEIRLKETGLESIQVTDNGSGIREQDFEQLCLKYTTSKISSLEDLKTVKSLGFRGEALSSLCALASVRILTKTEEAEIGFILEFDHDGKITKKMAHPRVRGTTVTVTQMFKTLPVRRKYLETQLKSQANKLRSIIMSYALALPQVRLILRDDRKGNSLEVINVPSVETFESKLIPVLKSIPFWEPFELSQDMLLEVAEEFNVKTDHEAVKEFLKKIDMKACISRAGHGRSNADFQFISINGRPVEMTKLNKILNQTFRSFDPTGGGNQYPFFVINLTLPSEYIDVNVTPDKRTILISQENTLFAAIKSSLIDVYGRNAHSVRQSKYSESSSQVTIIGSPNRSDLPPPVSLDFDKEGRGDEVAKEANQRLITDYVPSKPRTAPSNDFPGFMPASSLPCSTVNDNRTSTPMRLESSPNNNLRSQRNGNGFEEASDRLEGLMTKYGSSDGNQRKSVQVTQHTRSVSRPRSRSASVDPNVSTASGDLDDSHASTSPSSPQNFNTRRTRTRSLSGGDTCQTLNKRMRTTDGLPLESPISTTKTVTSRERSFTQNTHPTPKQVEDKTKNLLPKRRTVRVSVDMNAILGLEDTGKESTSRFSQPEMDADKSEEQAIEEMSRKLNKTDFFAMKILGQFNRGFILTQLDSDIFVVDQHAAEERRNFDSLLSTYELEPQKLMSPEQMTLSPYQEHVLKEHMAAFISNGFRFHYDATLNQGERYQLTAVPSYYDKILGKKDAEEFIDMIVDAPGISQSLRPSRVKEILAMKACKKSIKIGEPLPIEKMKLIVKSMGETRSPWTCAHGRPTIRFLHRLSTESS